MAVPHPAVLPDAYPLAVLLELFVAFLLGLAGLEALRGVLVRVGHRAVSGDVFLDRLPLQLPVLPERGG